MVRPSIPGRSSTGPQSDRFDELDKPNRGVVPQAQRVVQLELGGRAGKPAAGHEHSVHLGEKSLRVADMLEHLLAVDQFEASVSERHGDAVERLEAGIAAGAVACFRGVGNVETHPLDVGIARSEQCD